MSKKIDDALSVYNNSRSILEAQEQKTKILAGMAGETYDPDQIPKTGYSVEMRMREAMQKENEFLESIAENSVISPTSANGLSLDYGTDVLSLQHNGTPISGGSVTLPAYGLNYDSATGGLTLTENGSAVQGQTVEITEGANGLALDYGTDSLSLERNGTPMSGGSVTLPAYGLSCNNSENSLTLTKNGSGVQGQTVSLPNYGLGYNTATGGLTLTRNGVGIDGQTVSLPPYGSPLTASSTAEMTDTDKVYVNTTDGKWYYYDGSAWTEGGTYNSQGIDTDTTLAVSGAPADAKAAGDKITNLTNNITETTGNSQIAITESNKYINLSGTTADIESPTTSTSGFCCSVVQCSEGDKFTLNAVGGTSARAYGFLGAITTGTTRTVLETAPENFVANDYLIVAPSGSEYLVINDKSGGVSYVGYIVRKRFNEKSPKIQNTITNSVVKFDDGAENFPVDSLVVNIDLIQSGSGNPSLTNIRPMSGWNGIHVYHSDEDTENPQTLTITFPDNVGTVYGGTLDLVSGTLKVTSVVYKASDFVSYDKSSSTSFDEFYFRVTNVKSPSVASSSASTSIKCSHARSGQTANASYTQCRISSSQPRILFPVGSMTSKSAFATWLQGQANNDTPLQFWYTINTVTYYLTAYEIKTLLGYNSFWCDSGNTKIVYNADTKIYIDQAGALPVYWKEEISTSVSAIHANQMAGDYSSPTICFITDCHWKDNKHYSPRIVKEIIEKCNIDYFVNGGDIILDYNPNGKNAAANELWDCINAFRGVGKPMITLYGNHDRNRDGNPDRDVDGYALSRKEHIDIVYKSYWTDPGITFYTAPGENTWDMAYWEDRNYRYVITYWYLQNSARMPTVLLTEMFNTTKPVVIFNHGIYFTLDSDMSQDSIQGGWLVVDCEPYKNQIKCFIQGHAHQDGLRWAYDGLVPIIVMDCDRFRDTKSIEGTASEQCVSVITINSNSIKIVRVGRGLDLEITQDTAPFLVKYTDYVPSIVECT